VAAVKMARRFLPLRHPGAGWDLGEAGAALSTRDPSLRWDNEKKNI